MRYSTTRAKSLSLGDRFFAELAIHLSRDPEGVPILECIRKQTVGGALIADGADKSLDCH